MGQKVINTQNTRELNKSFEKQKTVENHKKTTGENKKTRENKEKTNATKKLKISRRFGEAPLLSEESRIYGVSCFFFKCLESFYFSVASGFPQLPPLIL